MTAGIQTFLQPGRRPVLGPAASDPGFGSNDAADLAASQGILLGVGLGIMAWLALLLLIL